MGFHDAHLQKPPKSVWATLEINLNAIALDSKIIACEMLVEVHPASLSGLIDMNDMLMLVLWDCTSITPHPNES